MGYAATRSAQQPIWAMSQVPGSPFSLQLPANVLGKQKIAQVLESLRQWGRSHWNTTLRAQHHPALATAPIWGMRDPFLTPITFSN